MKKLFLPFLVVFVLFLGYQCAEQQTAYAGAVSVYTDKECSVSVLKVYRKSNVSINADVRFVFPKRNVVETTHYEFLHRNGVWVFRSQQREFRKWQPVTHNRIAKAIFDYVCS